MPYIIRNKNQWRKVYPGVRRKPVYEVLQRMEVGILMFDNSDEETFTFNNSYDIEPTVTISTVGPDANVSICSINLSNSAVTVSSSAKFTGEVHLQVVERM